MARKNSIVSIDIGESSIKVAQLDIIAGKRKISGLFIFQIPSDNRDRFIYDTLSNIAKELPTKDVYLILSHPSICTRRLSLPNMPEHEIPQAIRWQIKDDVSFGIEKSSIDFQLIGESTDESGAKKIDLICVAVSGEVIQEALSLTKRLNLTLKGINTAPFSILSILKTLDLDLAEGAAVLEVSNKTSGFYVFKDNRLVFYRSFPIGSHNITNAMTGVLVSGKGRVELSLEQAEKIKKAVGTPQPDAEGLPENISPLQIIAMMRPVLEQIAGEVRRSLNYFSSQFGDKRPAQLYLAGGGARLKGLGDFLSKELGMEAGTIPVPRKVDCTSIKDIEETFPQAVFALGGALAYRDKVNLLPEVFRPKKVLVYQKISLRMVTIIVTVIFILSYFAIKLRIADYTKRIQVAKSHLATLQEVKDLGGKVSMRENLLKTITQKNIPSDWVLKELSNIVPAEVILEELLLVHEKQRLDVKGYLSVGSTAAHGILSNFMEKIEGSPFFEEADLVSVEGEMKEGKEVSVFKIEVRLVKS